jgi:hypothetical protein
MAVKGDAGVGGSELAEELAEGEGLGDAFRENLHGGMIIGLFDGCQEGLDGGIDGGGLLNWGQMAGGNDLDGHGVRHVRLHGEGYGGRGDAVFGADDDEDGDFQTGQKVALIATLRHGGKGVGGAAAVVGGLGFHEEAGLGFHLRGRLFAEQLGEHGVKDLGGSGGSVFVDSVDGFETVGADFSSVGIGTGVDEHSGGNAVGELAQQGEQDITAHGEPPHNGAAASLSLNDFVDVGGIGLDGGVVAREGRAAAETGERRGEDGVPLVAEKGRLAFPHRGIEWEPMDEQNGVHDDLCLQKVGLTLPMIIARADGCSPNRLRRTGRMADNPGCNSAGIDSLAEGFMRPRTPTFLWIPFVFSVGTISWVLLLVGLVLFSGVILTPAWRDLKVAETDRNNYQATLDLLDQKIAMQTEFMAAATKDPVLMERLAARQLNLNRPDQEVLVLDPAEPYRDHSVETLLAESLTKVTPAPVAGLPKGLEMTLQPGVRSGLVLVACVALALSFFLGVRYER